MLNNSHVYFFNYDDHESDLCKMEARHIFDQEIKDKLIFSDIKINPASSAFIRKRIDVIVVAEDHSCLIKEIKNKNIRFEGFKVEYLVLHGDTSEYAERLEKLKDIGKSIEGSPNYQKPTRTYALCQYKGIWYFGISVKNNIEWHQHKGKPCSYCNSIGINIAKALVNIAAQGKKDKKLIDVCCGVGTIMLEACFAGYNIEGCDINAKICNDARENLSHFNYDANVICSDIKDISKRYDAAIIDLPYNLFSYSNEEIIFNIIESTAGITDRVIIVSGSDISGMIDTSGLEIIDHCSLKKRGNTSFKRKIWLCKKPNVRG